MWMIQEFNETLGLSKDQCAMRLYGLMDIPWTDYALGKGRWNAHKQAMNKLWASNGRMTGWYAMGLNLNQRLWTSEPSLGLSQASDIHTMKWW